MMDLTPFQQALSARTDAGEARRQAMERFQALGLPGRRLEDWRYTDVSKHAWAALAGRRPASVTPAFDLGGCRVDLINGEPHLPADLPSGLSLSSGLPVIGSDSPSGLEALNAALVGSVLHLTADTVETPVHLAFRAADAGQQAIHNRMSLTVRPGGRLFLFSDFAGDDTDYWHNLVTDIDLGAGAELIHVVSQKEGGASMHSALTRVALGKGARYRHFALNTGAAVARSDVLLAFEGAEAEAGIHAAQMARPGQSLDLRTFADHKVGGSQSLQQVKAVVAAQGRASFQGKVRVARDAQQTDAQQQSNNLLLDRAAEANTKPELEIYADDVACAHGATVGELDEAALFYLVSRGLDPESARATLIRAFAAGAFDGLDHDHLRDWLVDQTGTWLDEEQG